MMTNLQQQNFILVSIHVKLLTIVEKGYKITVLCYSTVIL